MNARRFAIAVWALTGAAALVSVAASAAGFRLNTTASAPSGLWRVSALAPQAVRRGDLISICPPEIGIVVTMRARGYLHPGDCAGTDAAPLLKPVIAIAGDRVTVSAAGVRVNGAALPQSAPEQAMPAFPAGAYTVKPGHVWLVSSYSAGSFDSRYFGPVPLALLRGQAAPVLVRGDISSMTIRGEPHDR